jgi:hypothetical protein
MPATSAAFGSGPRPEGFGVAGELTRSLSGRTLCKIVQNVETIQSYVNNFRRHLSPILRPDIGATITAYPSLAPGAVLVVLFAKDTPSRDTIEPPFPSVGEILKVVPQRMIAAPSFSGIRFGGTNISMEPNRIVLIKGEDDDNEWDDRAAARDVQRFANPPNRR